MPDRWLIATIRHGETDFNKEKRYAGSIDVDLNENGRREAKNVSRDIEAIGIDLCISSPLARAVETARILTKERIEIMESPYAQERCYGILEGLTSEDVENIRPPIHFIKVGNDYHSIDMPKAESFQDLHDRADRLVRSILDNHQGRRVLVVSHGVFLQQFHGVLRGEDWIDALRSHVGNLDLTLFEMEGDMVVSESRVHLTEKERILF